MKSVRSFAVGLFVLGVLSAVLAWKPDLAADQSAAPADKAPPEYWKGNLHTHSLWSDGDAFPEMIADWYKRHGYHFLALTDHNLLSEGQRWIALKGREVALKKYTDRFGEAWVERRTERDVPQVRLRPLSEFRAAFDAPGRFLMVPGEEITHRFAKLPIHINGINVKNVVVPVSGDSVGETIRSNIRVVSDQQKRTGIDMLAFLNHPNYGLAVVAEDIAQTEELRYFEVFNGHPGVNNWGKGDRPGTDRMWDIALALRLGKHRYPMLYGMATDDAHRYHTFKVGESNPGRGWIMVKAPSLAGDALVRAIQAGDFYLSSGVNLADIRREGEHFAFRIAAEKGVTYRTQFIATLRDAPLDARPAMGNETTNVYSPEIGKVVAETDSLTPSYRFTGRELYVRAKILSSKVHPNPFQKGDVEMAWTQPLVP